MNSNNNSEYEDDLVTISQGGDHYYGDIIRRLMIATGLVLIFLIPLDREMLPLYLTFGLLFIVTSVVMAGLTSPRSQLSIKADLAISLVIFCIFEFLAVSSYFKNETILNIVFILRQAMALISLGALYFSTKTLRGMYYKKKYKEIE